MTDESKAEAARMTAEEAVAIAALRDTVVYPRFLGIDGSGSYVWELEGGRWTWADDPHHALMPGRRTFEPECYAEKYGVPESPVTVAARMKIEQEKL